MEEAIQSKGIVLDLDGVVTDTREIHIEAWKEIFDNFLKERGRPPFSLLDYQVHVDGRPRQDGIANFLNSRGMPASSDLIQKLGDKKNRRYLELVNNRSLQFFPDAERAIKSWRSHGVPIAIVSSSKNCRNILEKLKISELFDVCVDGNDGEKLHLKGKPHPDYFLEATKQLKRLPEECILVEDAESGIMAGKKANFRTVYGISRAGQTPAQKLYSAGADMVIASLDETKIKTNALNAWENFKAHIGDREIALFIDFDGTISNIVSNPKDATIDPEIKDTLMTNSRELKVTIVSGRDRADVKEKVGVDEIFYAGCHGFEISGPGCFHYKIENTQEALSDLESANLSLGIALAGIEGVIIEKKKFGTAIHYRMVHESEQETVMAIVSRVAASYKSLKIKEGKKVLELVPNITWGKGKAVSKLCEILEINPEKSVPVYIGDDLTDEDAFLELHGKGIGIRVDGNDELTSADYVLANPKEVTVFLKKIFQEYGGKEKRWRPGS